MSVMFSKEDPLGPTVERKARVALRSIHASFYRIQLFKISERCNFTWNGHAEGHALKPSSMRQKQLSEGCLPTTRRPGGVVPTSRGRLRGGKVHRGFWAPEPKSAEAATAKPLSDR